MKINPASIPWAAVWLAAAVFSTPAANAVDKGPLDPQPMSEPELLSQVRQLTTEEFELTRFATDKATTDRVKQFAQRFMQHAQQIDTKLNDLAATGSVSAANKDNLSVLDEVSDTLRLQGAEVDKGYVRTMLHLSRALVPFYEQLAARAGNARLKTFARDSLASTQAQIKELDKM